MKASVSRLTRVRVGFLSMALSALFAAGNASAATCTVTVHGIPATVQYGRKYFITVAFSYTWTTYDDKPWGGAAIVLLEDDGPGGINQYAAKSLSPPANGNSNSGKWEGSVDFDHVDLAGLGAADGDPYDYDDILEILGRFKAFTPGADSYDFSIQHNIPAFPATPASITVPSTSATGIYKISWEASKGASTYDLQKRTDWGIWVNEAILGNVLEYQSAVAQAPGHLYHYRVRGSNFSGKSDWQLSPDGCLVPLQPPAYLNCPASDSDGTYTVSWGKSIGATGYELQSKTDSLGFYSTISSGAANNKIVSGKLPGHTYYYRVRAYISSSGRYSTWKTGSNGVFVSNPGVLAFTTAGTSVAEGTQYAYLKVVRTGGTSGPASIHYNTLNKTALAGQDYSARSGTLAWADGDAAAKRIKILITDDSVAEPNEVFKVVLSGATGATLGTPHIAKVTILANAAGSACAQANPADSPVPLSEAVDTDELAWETKMSAPWTAQNAVSADGQDAAMSGAGAPNGVSWLETSLTGPGTLEFDWRVITENPLDTLMVMDNGAVLSATSGLSEWERMSVSLPEGPQTIRWVFLKGLLCEGPAGNGFIDRVNWMPDK